MKICLSLSTNVSLTRSHSFSSLVSGVSQYRHVLVLYLVPAALYCLYNNLSFLSLAYFNPTTYFMFMQIRLLLTGVIYQVNTFFLVNLLS